MSQLPPEQDGPFLVSIGLNWFLDKFTSGVLGYITVSKEFGDYLRSLDPLEQHTHVDYPPDRPLLAMLYSRATWQESLRRLDLSRQRSEADRQSRFQLEAKALELRNRYLLREQEITRVTLVLSQRASKFVNNTSKKLVRMSVINMLNGNGQDNIRQALGICPDTVAQFKSLPQPVDPIEEELLLSLLEEKPSEEARVL